MSQTVQTQGTSKASRDLRSYVNPDGTTLQDKLLEFITTANAHGFFTAVVLASEKVDGGQGYILAGNVNAGTAPRIFLDIAKSLASNPQIDEKNIGGAEA